MVGPGDSEIGLNLAAVVPVDGAWIFIFSVVRLEVDTFHLASNTEALPLSSTGHVALARPASINVVAGHSKEPLEDLLIPHLVSTNGVHRDFALCFAELKESWRLPTRLDQLGPEIRQPMWHTGAKWPSLWTKAPFGTWQGVELI